MTETVYIETSIIGYLSARSSNNLILMANVEATREWWDSRRSQFALYISQVVLDEVARGDSAIADRAVGATVEFREKLLVSIASQPLTDSSPSLLNLS